MVLYCAAEPPLDLLPEPDPSVPPRTRIAGTTRVAILAELGGWARVETREPPEEPVHGWVPRAMLKAYSETLPRLFTLFREPMAEIGEPFEGRLHKRLLDLGSWLKVSLKGSDGTIRTGWVRQADLEPANAPAPGAAPPVAPATGIPAVALSLGVNAVYESALIEARQRTGIDAAALAAMVDAEASVIRSGPEKGRWNPRAFNEASGAAGLTQFVRSTWLGHAKLAGTALRAAASAQGFVDGSGKIVEGQEAALLELRFDPRLSILSAAEYGASNLRRLVGRGLVEASAPDDRKAWFMYLAHHEGFAGAAGFLDQTRIYTLANLTLQVGAARAAALIAEYGDANRAYRGWLSAYIDQKIRPERFRVPGQPSTNPAGAGIVVSPAPARPPGAPAPARGTIAGYWQLDEGARALLENRAGPALPFDGLGAEPPLVIAVQQALSLHGYLDPPADGKYGPISLWALHEFAKRQGFPLAEGFTGALARALADPARALPARRAAGHWIDRVLAAMERESMFLCRHPACCNIIYVEGMDVDGRLNDDRPNRFNDARIVVRFDESGLPLVEAWDATTEPGDHFTDHPMNPAGAARIAFGQYKAWRVGRHMALRPSGHEALVQVEPITVHRDFNQDHKRTGDALDFGLFGINQHWGYDADPNDIGNTSAGCLVGRAREEHRAFMARVKGDARFKVNKGYCFVTAILAGDKL